MLRKALLLPKSSFSRLVRTLFIQTQDTPNPNSLKFLPGQAVVADGGTVDFPSMESSVAVSPLARQLFHIDGVAGVMLGADFVTVRKVDDVDWSVVKPQVFAQLMDFLQSGLPAIKDGALEARQKSKEQEAMYDDEDEVVQMIHELMNTKIRPTVQEDGGDIEFMKFEDGVVHLRLQGSCTGCPSSSVTLKQGIESMLKFYIPEVQAVEQYYGEEERIADEEFEKLEMKIKRKGVDDVENGDKKS